MAEISFARGIPGPDLLPTDGVRRGRAGRAAHDGARALNYGPPSGYPPLRDWVAGRHDVAPERIVLTTGSLQGFHFVASTSWTGRDDLHRGALLRPLGRHPPRARRAGRRRSRRPTKGSTWTRSRSRSRAPPAPRSSTRSRRSRTRAGARSAGRAASGCSRSRATTATLVLEDDPYGLLRFEGEDVPTIFELSGGESLFLSSFSKTVAPGIRVGFVILPEELVGAVERQVLENYVSPSIFVQATLAEFVAGGQFERNIETVRDSLRSRRDAMLDALDRELLRHGRAGTAPTAATSSGSTCPASTRPRSCSARRPRASRSSRAPTSSSRAAASSPPGSPSASRAADAIGEGVARLAASVPVPA